MLTIRFSRIGKKKKPFYRVIISESKKDTQGRYLELLGQYDPHTKIATLKVERIKHWIGVGATMSNSVFNLFVKEKVISSEKKKKSVRISKKRASKIADKSKSADEKKEKETVTEKKEEESVEGKSDAHEEKPQAVKEEKKES